MGKGENEKPLGTFAQVRQFLKKLNEAHTVGQKPPTAINYELHHQITPEMRQRAKDLYELELQKPILQRIPQNVILERLLNGEIF